MSAIVLTDELMKSISAFLQYITQPFSSSKDSGHLALRMCSLHGYIKNNIVLHSSITIGQ
jgi:hypothetical protein